MIKNTHSSVFCFSITLAAHFRPNKRQLVLVRNIRKSAKSRFQVFSSWQWALISRQLLVSFRSRKEDETRWTVILTSLTSMRTDSHSETLWKEREREKTNEEVVDECRCRCQKDRDNDIMLTKQERGRKRPGFLLRNSGNSLTLGSVR